MQWRMFSFSDINDDILAHKPSFSSLSNYASQAECAFRLFSAVVDLSAEDLTSDHFDQTDV